MQHSRMFPYLAGAAVVAAVLIAVGAPLASLLPFALFLACPLMMIFMMKGMSKSHDTENHTGHGCEHDTSARRRQAESGKPPTVASGPSDDRVGPTSAGSS